MMGEHTRQRGAVFVVAGVLPLALLTTSQAEAASAPPLLGPESDALSLSSASAQDSDPHLFGDWSGLRSYLHGKGVDVDLSYTGEMASDVAGGKRQGTDYAGQEEAKFDFDFKTIAGWRGFSTHLVFVNRTGRNASADYVGDDLIHAQEIYGGGGNVVAHLVYLYGEQKLADDKVTVKAGRLPVMNDFGALPDGCDFMSLTICATRPLDANLGWTSFPRSTWGGNAFGKLGDDLSLGSGLYEVNPETGGRAGFHWSLQGATGEMVPVELDWKPKLGGSPLSGVYKFGAWLDTAQFPEWDTAINGAPLSITPLPARRTLRGGVYLLTQQQVWSKGGSNDDGLTALAGYVYNSDRTSLFQHFAFLGLLDKGPFASRPGDRAGLEFTYARVSNKLTEVQEPEAALDEPLSNGAPGVQKDEMYVEANYNVAAYRGVDVMPDLQYVVRPSASSAYSNAFVLGLQLKVDF